MNRLTDGELLSRARALIIARRNNTSELVAVVGEIDRKRSYKGLGRTSTFDYCAKDLGLAEDDAVRLVQAARVARAHPELLSRLADGTLSLRAASMLSAETDAPDFRDLAKRLEGRSIREAERILGERRPAERKPDVVKVAGVASPPPAAEPAQLEDLLSAPPRSPAVLLYRFEFTADEQLKDKLDRARCLLAAKYPRARMEDIVTELADAFLARRDPLIAEPPAPGAIKNLRARRPAPSVKARVWRRDEGRCAFVLPSGERCGSAHQLELDHELPWSAGGLSDAGNLRLLCRAHNQQLARARFGEPPKKEDRRG